MDAAVNHMTWSRPGSRGVLALPLTKSGQRSGTPEGATIYDPWVAALLYFYSQELLPGANLWRGPPKICGTNSGGTWAGSLWMGISPSRTASGVAGRRLTTSSFIIFNRFAFEDDGTRTVLASSTLPRVRGRLVKPICQTQQIRRASTTLANFELLSGPACSRSTPWHAVLFCLLFHLPETFTCIVRQNWDKVIVFGVWALRAPVLLCLAWRFAAGDSP